MKIFQDSCKIYIETLKSSGIREEFTYHEPKGRQLTRIVQKRLIRIYLEVVNA